MNYSIKSSMFDCVVASTGRYAPYWHTDLYYSGYFRFLFSLVFYGIFHISHWWPITCTTTATIAFLIAKVLRFQVLISLKDES